MCVVAFCVCGCDMCDGPQNILLTLTKETLHGIYNVENKQRQRQQRTFSLKRNKLLKSNKNKHFYINLNRFIHSFIEKHEIFCIVCTCNGVHRSSKKRCIRTKPKLQTFISLSYNHNKFANVRLLEQP